MHFSAFVSAALAVLPSVVSAKSVFAHVVVGDTAAHDVAKWGNDILLAKNAGIDAFVLNIGFPDSNIPIQVANAFRAAEQAGSAFKLFLAFDYLGGGQTWPATGGETTSVVGLVNKYKNSAAYFKFNGLPFVSTFEGGTTNMADWAPNGPIRSGTGGVYFVPNWDGSGINAVKGALANIDGFFSWNMWPNGATNKTTDNDFAWKNAIGSSKSYMMGVSPWFFHSGAGGLAPWVWRGDDLWADRWAQTLTVQPEFVQIVTWNDYGEAHYIGPIGAASEIPTGSGQYVNNMPHDSFRDFLPYYIARYKGSSFTISRDQLQYWYRTAPAAGGQTCGVTGNSASQGQSVVSPNQVMEDGIFFSALLSADSVVTVQIGSGPVVQKQGKTGINHWSVPFNGQTGVPTFKVVRSGVTGKGTAITSSTTLASGCTNYNVWAGSA
ncbi:hypothetical protein HYFRA_00000087 [Hymenoscyphus fraxineus]|uniref:Glycoside hydrolase family 71 protein n=1 Tax=Hymenoscyphus fraxineus TaxID=746836 RepID=A0A9N9L1I1_9HELO|nr:hypothetical protein HYFRA_00000087 [Hymenoscyphus fraxineus]